jgi:hypothetical protein
VLALPAAVWVGAALETAFADCGYTCGDRARGWFFGVLVTAPLIPLGAAIAVRGLERPSWLGRLGGLGCVLVEGVFVLIGVASLAAATGITDAGSEASPEFYVVAAFCFAIAFFVERVRRRVPRT